MRFNTHVDELKKMFGAGGDNPSYKTILKLRRNLDKRVNHKKYTQSNPTLAGDLQGLSSDVAGHLRGFLVEGAEKTGVKEYAPAMKAMAKKYDAHDRLNS